jgi:hypothetical protein
MTIIGLCGKMGVGKDYIAAKYIIPIIEQKMKQRCLQLSFADQIKANVMTKNNISYEDVYVRKTDETRRLLQREGTENGRNIIGKDIWIKYFDNWCKIFTERGIDHFISCDVRFCNEIEYIKNMKGIIIKVEAPSRNQSRLMQESKGDLEIYNRIKSHVSECNLDDLDDSVFDIIIKNEKDELDAEMLERRLVKKLLNGSFL